MNLSYKIIISTFFLGLLFTVVNAGEIKYEYDELDRISKVFYPNLTVVQYKYDAIGNRTEVTLLAEGIDTDGDGVPDNLDSFPNDASEWFDSDGDLIGDNKDRFPLDSLEQSDFDGDLIGDNSDTDSDNDGVDDIDDGCPLNPAGYEDIDGDGLCGIDDADTDGDGVANIVDAFPNDPSESKDSDGDLIGDNQDQDDDNDGINDALDECPFDPSGFNDQDNDGSCDNVVLTEYGLSFWSALEKPLKTEQTAARPVEVGMKFSSELSGYILGVRYYKTNDNNDIVTGSLWDSKTRKKIATSDFSVSSEKGWQETLFSDPVAIEAGKEYVISYFSPSGLVSYNKGYFLDQGLVRGPLLAKSNTFAKGNGVYRLFKKSIFPSVKSAGNNYWVDVVFDTDGDGIKPSEDPDDDNDGIPDTQDACPFDPLATKDTDGDSICDVHDDDIDGDGVDNIVDLFPLDSAESIDTDGDGIGDNNDLDDDNDTVVDSFDQCPKNAKGYNDQNGDKRCDNANITENGLSLWNDYVLPKSYDLTNSRGIETGIKFVANVDGYVSGVRFFKDSSNQGLHIANLWDVKTKKNLGRAEFINETPSGWQEVLFSEPIAVTANTQYVASYYSPSGSAIYEEGYFASQGINSGPLSAQADKIAKGNGVYRYLSRSIYPHVSGKGKNYWVDVVFEVDGDGIPPQDDIDDDNDQVPDALDACPFDPQGQLDMDNDGICDSTDADIDGDGYANDVDVFPLDSSEYNDSDQDSLGDNADTDDDNDQVLDIVDQCPLDPSGYLDSDEDGKCDNEVLTEYGLSLWSDLSEPDAYELTNSKGIEAGMKFVSSQNGYVMGLRFFKNSENVGEHIGNLWDFKTRQLIASTNFENETASGWQESLFDAPVQIELGKTYIVSYYSPSGHAIIQKGFFKGNGVISGPLSAQSNEVAKGNGVFRVLNKSVFPSVKSPGNNYWVDVIFEIDGDSIKPSEDPDDDNDGAPDLLDACPFNSYGSIDDDGDGVCNSQDVDLDGDGVINSEDAFPNDPTEYIDTDDDGVGDNADTDDDADGKLDIFDQCPLDIHGYNDQNQDGYCDNINLSEQGFSIWNSSSKPDDFEQTPKRGIEVGLRFSSAQSGYVSGVKFYKNNQVLGEHTVNLWDLKTKKNLAKKVVDIQTSAEGWQSISFDESILIEANKTYVISYFSSIGEVLYQDGYFSQQGKTSGFLQAPSDKLIKGNGVFKYSKKSIYPLSGSKGKHYFVDVLFDLDNDGIAPTVDVDNDNDGIDDDVDECPYNPLGSIDSDGDGICDSQDSDIDGDGVANDSDLYPYDPNEFRDFDSDNIPDNADLDDDNDGVDDANDICPLDPSGYTDINNDGLCDNPNDTGQGLSIWSNLAKPQSQQLTTDAPIEVGMKFKSLLGGKALGVRFYKHPENTGIHIGNLWDAKTKKKLASILFTNEELSGWQQALFNEPVLLEPGKEYVVSYHSSNGNVAVDEDYFSINSITSGNLVAIGGLNKNGFYQLGSGNLFPKVNGKGKNYWVDIIMDRLW